MWDDFIKYVTEGVGQSHGIEKIIVFIDEVDKMKDVGSIGRFMLILKALYNPLNLFFVVSISEDVYKHFQKKLAPFYQRGEFDSTFDHLLEIVRMDFGQTSNLLNKRILGYDLPIPAIVLIWILSRGNPRDIVRLAREVLAKFQEKDCAEIALEFCTSQLTVIFNDFFYTADDNYNHVISLPIIRPIPFAQE